MATATQTREKPILFSGEMVRQILAGKKTQTRRVIKPQPYRGRLSKGWNQNGTMKYVEAWRWEPTSRDLHNWHDDEDPNVGPWCKWFHAMCPYGGVGDRLWVRETFGFGWDSGAGFYTALSPSGKEKEPEKIFYKADGKWDESNGKHCWRPSIHMPRWASRLTLEITDVHVQQIQEISAKDIIAEGAVDRPHEVVGLGKCPVSAFDKICYPDLRSLWAAGWDKINGKGSWDENPWVWALTFRVLKKAEVR
jgi:hypothetical protein